jgi:hypothetical protein
VVLLGSILRTVVPIVILEVLMVLVSRPARGVHIGGSNTTQSISASVYGSFRQSVPV